MYLILLFFCLYEKPMYLIFLFVSYWCKNELIQGSIFEFFRQNPIANEQEVDWSMLQLKIKMRKLQLNGKSAFYARKTLQELSFHVRNYVQSSRTSQVLQQLMKLHLIFYGLNRSTKKTLN